MFRLFAWLSTLFLLLAAALLFVATQALEREPLVQRSDEVALGSIARAKEILRRNDPRQMQPNATRTVRLTGPDLETLLNFAVRRGIAGDASLALRQGGADVRYSANLSPRLKHLGLGQFLNVDARLGSTGKGVEIEQVRVGRVPLPATLVEKVVLYSLRYTDMAPDIDLLAQTIAHLEITPKDVAITYVWNPALLDSARALAVTPAERERLAAAHLLLVKAMNRAGPSGGKVQLAKVLGPLLQAAGDNAKPNELSRAYRDVLFAAALHLSGKNVALLIPEAARWPKPRPMLLTLRDRGDLAQHFVISAAIAVMSGEPLAHAVGLEKELADANGGSGFSFVDLAADRAGTRLGRLAAEDPRRLAAAVAAGFSDAALLPSLDGLPEHMQAAEFQQRFGGVDGEGYRQLSNEIDHRVAALALFR